MDGSPNSSQADLGTSMVNAPRFSLRESFCEVMKKQEVRGRPQSANTDQGLPSSKFDAAYLKRTDVHFARVVRQTWPLLSEDYRQICYLLSRLVAPGRYQKNIPSQRT